MSEVRSETSVQLRCYCCGEPVSGDFAIASMAWPTDRVFIVSLEHLGRLDDVKAILVREIEGTP